MRATRRDPTEPVYEPARARLSVRRALAVAALAGVVAVVAPPRIAVAQNFETTVTDARDALRKRDRARLAALKTQAAVEQNPLSMWVDYWEFTNRINDVQPAEFSAFAERWKGTYVEDRLRNDWLLELIRRRDRATFAAEYPRFRMNDDREVTCFALADAQLSGNDVRETAIATWLAQKDADDGCAFLATTLNDAKLLPQADVWKKLRAAGRRRRSRAASSRRRPAAAAWRR